MFPKKDMNRVSEPWEVCKISLFYYWDPLIVTFVISMIATSLKLEGIPGLYYYDWKMGYSVCVSIQIYPNIQLLQITCIATIRLWAKSILRGITAKSISEFPVSLLASLCTIFSTMIRKILLKGDLIESMLYTKTPNSSSFTQRKDLPYTAPPSVICPPLTSSMTYLLIFFSSHRRLQPHRFLPRPSMNPTSLYHLHWLFSRLTHIFLKSAQMVPSQWGLVYLVANWVGCCFHTLNYLHHPDFPNLPCW